jgi:hypothetical protein
MCNCKDWFDKVKRVGRAHWVCGECGDDISWRYVLTSDAMARDKELKREKKAKRKGKA